MHPLAADLDHVLTHSAGLWDELRGGRLFLTGGTGFVGCWLLESLLWANARLALQVKAVVLTRNPDEFRRKAPHLAEADAVQLWPGRLEDFPLPEGRFTHIVHAAAELSSPQPTDPAGMMRSALHGLERVLDLCCRAGSPKILFTSSGAVYGPARPGRERVAEDAPSNPIPLEARGAYAETKRMAELLGCVAAQQHGFEFKIARGFAFLGPYLPLEGPLAAGNFIRDALRGGPVIVAGSGTAVRSYLYAADMAWWLWTLLFRARSGRAYNLGSDQPVTIADLARSVARACEPAPAVHVLGQPRPGEVVDYYVPDLARSRSELGLEVLVGLDDGIRRTLAWHRARGSRV